MNKPITCIQSFDVFWCSIYKPSKHTTSFWRWYNVVCLRIFILLNSLFGMCIFLSDPTITIKKNTSAEMRTVVVSMGTTCVYSLVLETLEEFENEAVCLILQNCHLVKEWPKEILHQIQVHSIDKIYKW